MFLRKKIRKGRSIGSWATNRSSHCYIDENGRVVGSVVNEPFTSVVERQIPSDIFATDIINGNLLPTTPQDSQVLVTTAPDSVADAMAILAKQGLDVLDSLVETSDSIPESNPVPDSTAESVDVTPV